MMTNLDLTSLEIKRKLARELLDNIFGEGRFKGDVDVYLTCLRLACEIAYSRPVFTEEVEKITTTRKEKPIQ